MTERQRKIYVALREYVAKHGQGPSIYELVELTGLPYSTIRYDLKILADKGMIDRVKGRVRGVALKPADTNALDEIDHILDDLVALGKQAEAIRHKVSALDIPRLIARLSDIRIDGGL